MTITATTPLSEGSQCYGSFQFDDGATVRVSGGLICSEHGRRHCRHHQLAHDAIIAKAASHEAATATAAAPAICWECGDALRSDQTGHYCDWCAPIADFLKTNAFKPTDPEPEPPAPSSIPVLGILVEQQREDAERAARFVPKLLCCFCREQPGKLQKRAGLFCSEDCFGWFVQAKHELLTNATYGPDEIAEWDAFGVWLDAETAKLEAEAMGFVWDERAQAWVLKLGQELLEAALGLQAADDHNAAYECYEDSLPGEEVQA